tara:strand:+ start:277 stop:879 length:603 start_codon:yes stop_codon:yes gene_type:complete
MNAKDAILKIRALFEDMPVVEAPKEDMPKETKIEMAEYSLMDGTKVFISELAVGGIVTLEDGSFAPMGEHTLADGTSIQLDDKGAIIEIASPAEDVVPEEVIVEDMSKKQDAKMAEMSAAYDEKINQLLQANTELVEKIKDIEAKNKEGFKLVVEMMEEFGKVPSADPIEAPKSYKFEQTKDIKFDRLNKYRNAILNNKN